MTIAVPGALPSSLDNNRRMIRFFGLVDEKIWELGMTSWSGHTEDLQARGATDTRAQGQLWILDAGYAAVILSRLSYSKCPELSGSEEKAELLNMCSIAQFYMPFPESQRIGFQIAFLFDGITDVIAPQRLTASSAVDKSFRCDATKELGHRRKEEPWR
ncbi:hypothetical protein C8J56DRAFT_115353 [Mycena floridula]|nr:hypothetical protein C8J56DRAFT_115353 [Mycena floridula]